MELDALPPTFLQRRNTIAKSTETDDVSLTESTPPLDITTPSKEDDEEGSGRADSEVSSNWGDDENIERGNWSSRLETILSLLGFTIGLGNMWRFPYLLHRHGGVAFLVPYLILTVLFGLPIAYLELAFGQFASLGPVTIWKCVPLFKGIGYSMVGVSSLIAVYYNVILAWALFYLFASMQQQIPWATCDNSWNTKHCTNISTEISLSFKTKVDVDIINSTNETTVDGFLKRVPSDEYFHYHVLNANEGLHEGLGLPSWQLVLCSFILWIVILASLIRGIKSSGKVALFTATFPFLALFVFLGVGLSQEGYEVGLRYFFKPDIKKLISPTVWLDAATQLIYTLGPCIGGLITLASYSRFHHRSYQDAFLLVMTNTVLSVLVGLVVFIHLGYMSYSLGLEVSQVLEEGPGIIFIVFTHALTLLPFPTMWSLLFFLLLITLGLDSQLFLVETVTTAIIDEKPMFWRKRKLLALGIVCTILFIAGIILTTRGGIYLITIMDTYVGSWPSLVIGILECIALMWIYGLDRFLEDMEAMQGKKPSRYWQILWKYVSPMSLMVVVIFAIGDYQFATYGTYVLPLWANIGGWLVAGTLIMFMPGYMIYLLCIIDSTNGGITNTIKPAIDWGPALEQHRWLTRYHKPSEMDHRHLISPTEPVLLLQLDSLTDATKYGGVPHGYFLPPDKKRRSDIPVPIAMEISIEEDDSTRFSEESGTKQLHPDLQIRLLKILRGNFLNLDEDSSGCVTGSCQNNATTNKESDNQAYEDNNETTHLHVTTFGNNHIRHLKETDNHSRCLQKHSLDDTLQKKSTTSRLVTDDNSMSCSFNLSAEVYHKSKDTDSEHVNHKSEVPAISSIASHEYKMGVLCTDVDFNVLAHKSDDTTTNIVDVPKESCGIDNPSFVL